jgi:hypothetical protein
MNLNPLPKLALSVRQPWAWAIIHVGKDIENRSWHARHANRRTVPVGHRVCIHAAQGMTKGEYEDAAEFIEKITSLACPQPWELVRGGIIGTVFIDRGVTKSASPWFFGPFGIGLTGAAPIETPIRATGALGWFEWAQNETPWPEPARWMQPKPEVML